MSWMLKECSLTHKEEGQVYEIVMHEAGGYLLSSSCKEATSLKIWSCFPRWGNRAEALFMMTTDLGKNIYPSNSTVEAAS